MNGATAEPLVSTTRPPNTAIMMRTVKSQNFLRTRIKRHSSVRKFIAALSLELVPHGVGCRAGRAAFDPELFADPGTSCGMTVSAVSPCRDRICDARFPFQFPSWLRCFQVQL